MTQRVLVTGSAGFIGRHFAPQLVRDGYEVLGIDRRDVWPGAGFRHAVVDILNAASLRDAVREFRPSLVVHLAARTDLAETRDIRGYAANTEGTANLLDAIESVGTVVRAIYTSSQLVCRYGYVPRNDQDYAPDSLYGESKVEMERIVRRRNGGGVTWCMVRPTTVWGPGVGPHYRHFLRLVRRGRYFHIGNGPLMKAYSYIGNIVHQYLRLLVAPASAIHEKVFYLSDYESLSTRWYADEIAHAFGARPVPTYPYWIARLLARVGDAINFAGLRRFPFNSFRLRNILTEGSFDLKPTEAVVGPLPFTAAEGVKKTAEWFVAFENGDAEALWTGGLVDQPAASSPTSRRDNASEARRGPSS